MKRHGKPFFFMEAGCPSRQGSEHLPNDWGLQGDPDESVQERYLETMFDRCDKREWVGGFMLWDWPATLYPEQQASANDDYCMYAKSGEATVRAYYKLKTAEQEKSHV
ncbi:hypothetical protein D3C84_1011410 [compost metagenome]